MRDGQGGRHLPYRSLTYLLPSRSCARAQNFPRFPSLPFSPIVLPLPLPPPHFHLPPLVSHLLLTLRASQDLHVSSVLSFPNANKKCVFQSLNNIMNNNKRPESLITCTWVSSTTIVGVSARKKYGRGQYVYLLQSRFVKYRSDVAPRKRRKRLSDSEVRDAILEDELARTSPLPTLNLVEDVEYLLSIKFSQILFSSCRPKVKNVSVNQRPWRPYLFSDRKKINLVENF